MKNTISYTGEITELASAIALITEKSWIDYAIQILPSITTIVVIIITYQSISRRIQQLKNEKIVEKDIDKLYEASEYLYDYLDMAGLFFSMMNKQSIRIKEGRDITGEHFKDKVTLGSDGLFDKFSDLKRSMLIFKTLEAHNVVKDIEKIHSLVLTNRKQQLTSIETFNKSGDFNEIEYLVTDYQALKLNLEIMSQNCIRDIIEYKKKISNH